MAFDNELGSVVESIYGNRKENYMIIRAIADYKVYFFSSYILKGLSHQSLDGLKGTKA
jgi:hypothetical protein